MKNNREKYIDGLINKFGFESIITLKYAEMCEKWESTKTNDSVLKELYKDLMQNKSFYIKAIKNITIKNNQFIMTL